MDFLEHIVYESIKLKKFVFSDFFEIKYFR